MSPSSPIESLPVAAYGFPGPLRDRLIAAILSGTKTTTSSLVEEYRRAGESLPRVGDREVVVDSAGGRVAVTQVTSVRVCRLQDVSDEHARCEGEGHDDVDEWRAEHRSFWSSAEFRAVLGAPEIRIDDDTAVVCVAFDVVGGQMSSRADATFVVDAGGVE